MVNLTFLKQPQTGDKGAVFWGALNSNIAQLDTHNHDGVNSALLSASAVQALAGPVLLSANWSAVSGQPGMYQQLATVPGGAPMSQYVISFKFSGGPNDGCPVRLHVVKNTDFSFYVQTNDPTSSIAVLYLT